MTDDPTTSRFRAALASPDPAAGLCELAAALRHEGLGPQGVYDLFEGFLAHYHLTDDEPARDAILEVMDGMAGWCHRLAPPVASPLVPGPNHVAWRFVAPLYLRVLHGHCAGLILAPAPGPERDAFVRRARRALAAVTPDVVEALLAGNNWRCRIAAAWLCGVKRWRRYADLIGGLLVPSTQCFAGQGYCFALARFADPSGARHLCRYLDEYLPQHDKRYDQHWAIPALAWVDAELGTGYASPYLRPGGPWEQLARGRGAAGPDLFAEARGRFDRLMVATDRAFGNG